VHPRNASGQAAGPHLRLTVVLRHAAHPRARGTCHRLTKQQRNTDSPAASTGMAIYLAAFIRLGMPGDHRLASSSESGDVIVEPAKTRLEALPSLWARERLRHIGLVRDDFGPAIA